LDKRKLKENPIPVNFQKTLKELLGTQESEKNQWFLGGYLSC
jgi:hypothetical protein